MRIARWYIAIDKRDFCSQPIDFMQFSVLLKVVAIVGIANWLRLEKKFIEKIFRIGKFQKFFGPLTMRYEISEIFFLLIFINVLQFLKLINKYRVLMKLKKIVIFLEIKKKKLRIVCKFSEIYKKIRILWGNVEKFLVYFE